MWRGLLLVLLVFVSACGKDGDAWARERYGEAGASALLGVAQRLTRAAEDPSFGPADEPARIPRPFVVLQRVPNENRLAFHPLNAKLPGSMIASTPDLARGIIIVEKVRNAEANGTMVVKRRTVTKYKYSLFYAIELYDRDGNKMTVSASDTHDQEKLEAALLALPQ
jgi:hypothetical protein